MSNISSTPHLSTPPTFSEPDAAEMHSRPTSPDRSRLRCPPHPAPASYPLSSHPSQRTIAPLPRTETHATSPRMYVALYEVLQVRWAQRAADLAAEDISNGPRRRKVEGEHSAAGNEGMAAVPETGMEVEHSNARTVQAPTEQESGGRVHLGSVAKADVAPLRSRSSSVPLVSPPAVSTPLPSFLSADAIPPTSSAPSTTAPAVNPPIPDDLSRRPPSAPPSFPGSHSHRVSARSNHLSTSLSTTPSLPPRQDSGLPIPRNAEADLARRRGLIDVVQSFVDVLGCRAEGWRTLEECEAQSMKRRRTN